MVTAKASGGISNGPKGVRKGDVRDDLWVLLVVLSKRTRRADYDLRIGASDVTLQERRIGNFHLIDRQGIIERAEWDLGNVRVSRFVGSRKGKGDTHTSPQSIILRPCWYGSSAQDKVHVR